MTDEQKPVPKVETKPEPKKPGRWKRFGLALAELAGQFLYRGPR